jgi:hypothetical protein
MKHNVFYFTFPNHAFKAFQASTIAKDVQAAFDSILSGDSEGLDGSKQILLCPYIASKHEIRTSIPKLD